MSERNLGLRCRPSLERLEDRCVPAVVLNVTDAGDTYNGGNGVGQYVNVGGVVVGQGNLRWCVKESNIQAGIDQIRFAAGINPVIRQALQPITDPVDIKGNGMNATTISAYDVEPINYRIFKIQASTVSTVIEDLRITKGRVNAENGGGVLNEGEVLMRRVAIDHCMALNGGGFANVGGGAALLDQVYIHHNTATGNGGGVYINTNSAPAVAVILSSNITYNTAARGGGVHNKTAGSETSLSNVTIEYNQASIDGGGLFNAFDSRLRMENGRISDNGAAGDGGGVWSAGDAAFTDVPIEWNTAGDQGGGFCLKSGTLSTTRGSIDHNNAASGTAYYQVWGTTYDNVGLATTINGTVVLGF